MCFYFAPTRTKLHEIVKFAPPKNAPQILRRKAANKNAHPNRKNGRFRDGFFVCLLNRWWLNIKYRQTGVGLINQSRNKPKTRARRKLVEVGLGEEEIGGQLLVLLACKIRLND